MGIVWFLIHFGQFNSRRSVGYCRWSYLLLSGNRMPTTIWFSITEDSSFLVRNCHLNIFFLLIPILLKHRERLFQNYEEEAAYEYADPVVADDRDDQ